MSARAPRERLIGIVVSLVLLLLIGWAATHSATSESDRHHDTVAALRSAGIRQARADVSGMEVTVYGVADDRHQREMALREVREVSGVRMVTDRLVVGHDDSEPTLTAAVASADPGPPTLAVTTSAAPAPAAPAPTTPPAKAAPARTTAPAPAPPVDSTDPCVRLPSSLRGQSVAFDDSSASLRGSGVNTLARFANHLRACPGALLEIRAFADQASDSGANLTLSRQRANVVVGHLSRDGIATHRLVATYRGDRSPGGNEAFLTLHTGANE